MLIETRRDKVIATSATAFFAGLLLLGALLQYHYGGTIFFRRVIAGITGCF